MEAYLIYSILLLKAEIGNQHLNRNTTKETNEDKVY